MSASACNYEPLPVTIVSGLGAWVTDDDGRPYLDCLAGYSALNFGHRHPRLVSAARRQLGRVTLTSRAFGSEGLEPFCQDLADLCAKEAVLVMNTGAEAVETAIKAARRWAYQVKGVPSGQAEIVVCDGNFHGRTTTIVGFSSDESARRGFGPFTPGFVSVPYGDASALAATLGNRTAAVLVEPVQGEAGVIVPPAGYLRAVRDACSAEGVLMIADEIQSGLGRTGTTFACDRGGVIPDVYLLGKALGGGIVPVSAVVANWDILGVFDPGSHGSTFGGNPLAAAIGHEVVAMLREGTWQLRAARLGAHLDAALAARITPSVLAVRTAGLWAGIDLCGDAPNGGRRAALGLLHRGVLAKETHGHTLRLSPPLVVTPAEIDWAVEALAEVIGSDVLAA